MGAPQWTTDGELLDTHFVGSRPAICSDGGTGALVFWGDQDHVNGQRAWTPPVPLNGGRGCCRARVEQPFHRLRLCGGSRWCRRQLGGFRDRRSRGPACGSGRGLAVGATGAAVVSSGSTNFGSIEIIPDGADAAYFVWEESRNDGTQANPKICAQRISAEGNTSWAADGVKVSGVTSRSLSGSQFPGCGGHRRFAGPLVGWTNSANGSTDIYAQRFTPSGTTLLPDGGLSVFTYPGVQVGEASSRPIRAECSRSTRNPRVVPIGTA